MNRNDRQSTWLRRSAQTMGVAGLGAVLAFGASGCRNNQAPAPIINNAAAPDQTAVDPNAGNDPNATDGNLAQAGSGIMGSAPASTNSRPTRVLGASQSYAGQQQGESYPDAQQTAPYQGGEQDYAYNADEAAGEQAVLEAQQAPPPLPEYDQPPAPEPNYQWTPGYWSYANTGYYWVPGAWVAPPYRGALWTPPYWGYGSNRYRFHRGYWGPHVGYYGGVDYGYGYVGLGFFGGYWHGRDFYYNRSVTRVGPVVRTVYERPVIVNNVRYGGPSINRISYNGGVGGLRIGPRPQEIAAFHERHEPLQAFQVQARISAGQNQGQFFNQNHGRPAQAFAQQPFGNVRGLGEGPIGQQGTRPSGFGNNQQQQHQALEQQRNNELQQRNTQLQQHNNEQQQRNVAEQQRVNQQQQRVQEQQQHNQQVQQQRSNQEQQRVNEQQQRNTQLQQRQQENTQRQQQVQQHQQQGNEPQRNAQMQQRQQQNVQREQQTQQREQQNVQHQQQMQQQNEQRQQQRQQVEQRPQHQEQPRPQAAPQPHVENRPAPQPHVEAPHTEAPHGGGEHPGGGEHHPH